MQPQTQARPQPNPYPAQTQPATQIVPPIVYPKYRPSVVQFYKRHHTLSGRSFWRDEYLKREDDTTLMTYILAGSTIMCVALYALIIINLFH